MTRQLSRSCACHNHRSHRSPMNMSSSSPNNIHPRDYTQFHPILRPPPLIECLRPPQSFGFALTRLDAWPTPPPQLNPLSQRRVPLASAWRLSSAISSKSWLPLQSVREMAPQQIHGNIIKCVQRFIVDSNLPYLPMISKQPPKANIFTLYSSYSRTQRSVFIHDK